MIAVQSVSILGSTGSIGKQALDVARNLGLQVTGLAAGHQVDEIERQIKEFRPAMAALADESAAEVLRERLKGFPTQIFSGAEGVCEVARGRGDIVLNAVVGIAGLAPTLAVIEAGKDLALANKESLVTGGELVIRRAKEKNVRIFPVDSEHSAIFQSLQGCAAHAEVKRLILTASGGPFFHFSREQLQNISPKEALNHPNWKMGRKITVDSATLINKGLELIEAAWLFALPPEKIKIVIHRQSLLHSAVEFADNAVIAQLGVADMRIPIQYALTYPHRVPSPSQELDWFSMSALTFERPDEEVFSGLSVCREAINRGGLVPTALNGANEEAVHLFLNGKIHFLDIPVLVRAASQAQDVGTVTYQNIVMADADARTFVRKAAQRLERK